MVALQTTIQELEALENFDVDVPLQECGNPGGGSGVFLHGRRGISLIAATVYPADKFYQFPVNLLNLVNPLLSC